MFPLILFDLDGTLTESGEGIMNAVAYACEKMGLPPLPEETRRLFVGPSLIESFMLHCGVDEAGAKECLRLYREMYWEEGWKQNRLYEGIAPLLQELTTRAYLAVASAKPQILVDRVTEYFGIANCFSRRIGITEDDGSSAKVELLKRALPIPDEVFAKEEVAMVGDRCYDIEAARALGFTAVGVGYGYGSREELEAAGCDYYAEDVAALRKVLLGL